MLELHPRSGNAEKLFLNAETYLTVRMNTVRLVGVISPGGGGQGGYDWTGWSGARDGRAFDWAAGRREYCCTGCRAG